MLGNLIDLFGTITSNAFNSYSNNQTNETNKLMNEANNLANKEIQDSVNLANKEMTEATNLANLQMSEATNRANAENISNTNASNEAIAKATNKANIQMQNEANATNIALNDSTNRANLEMNSETNEANRLINERTNETNRLMNEATNQANMDIAQANIDMQKEYNQQVFEREDNALSRKMEDSIKSGVNILSGINGSSSGGSASAPQNTATMLSAVANGYENKATTFNSASVDSAHAENYQNMAHEKSMYEMRNALYDATTYQSSKNQANSINLSLGMSGIEKQMAETKATEENTKAQEIDNQTRAIKNQMEIQGALADLENKHKDGLIKDEEYNYLKDSMQSRLAEVKANSKIAESEARISEKSENSRITVAKNEAYQSNQQNTTNAINNELLSTQANIQKQTQDEKIEQERLNTTFMKLNNNKAKAEIVNTWIKSGVELSSEVRAWFETLRPLQKKRLFGYNLDGAIKYMNEYSYH